MATPKKKLPTGPIRIQAPVTKKSETITAQALEPDTSSEETTNLEPVKQESTKLESFTLELIPETSNHTNVIPLQESSFIEASKLDAAIPDVQNPQTQETTKLTKDSASQESSFPESSLQESYLQDTDFKKVAMRLSGEAVAKLQQFRASSGIPYEILVDVMVRNWENLPQRTQNSYLHQAKQLRVQRLMAGQEKTMQTMKAKYLQ
ncbi:hypothetical protein CAL7716_104140 (plasmid) [Calothrix sp. PCC 7716]|nr:hypothetical protein CAL7716_104140 [Calothrix sp. PCC 7716]